MENNEPHESILLNDMYYVFFFVLPLPICLSFSQLHFTSKYRSMLLSTLVLSVNCCPDREK